MHYVVGLDRNIKMRKRERNVIKRIFIYVRLDRNNFSFDTVFRKNKIALYRTRLLCFTVTYSFAKVCLNFVSVK